MGPPVSAFLTFLYHQLFTTVPKPTKDYTDRVVIVTGGNVGLGLETARTIAALGAAKVIITSRDTAKGEAAVKDILSTTKRDASAVEAWPLDLLSYDSVRAFAQRANADLDRLDALICNAGVATGKFALADGGHETSITTNVISTFLLGFLLLPKLRQTAHRTNSLTHLEIVSSEVHYFTDFAERARVPAGKTLFAALSDEKLADMPDRYNVSKLLELFVVREIATTPKLAAPRAANVPYPVVVTAVNPGLCDSALRREFYDGPRYKKWGVRLFEWLLARSGEEGARNFVIAASAGKEFHGQYISDGKPTKPAKLVLSNDGKKLQKQVWEELRDILEEIEPGVTKNF